jgi:transcriptional regulator with XRE-family HTH domain
MPVLRLARMVGLSPQVIRRYMRGQSEPSVFVAMLIADALLCEVAQLWQVEVINVP